LGFFVKIKSVRVNKKGQKNSPVFFIVVSLFLIIFLVTSNLKIEKKRNELKKEIETLKAELQVLEEKNGELKRAISKAKSETFWEEKAREEGYIREGEEVIVIKKVGEEKKENSETIWQKMINFFRK
jgi:cell division protein FtsB